MMTEKEHNQYRREAHVFFQGLETYLNQRLPTAATVRRRLNLVMRRANASKGNRESWNKTPELAFLNEYIFRHVHRFVSDQPGMNKATACEALLVEGYKHCPRVASGTCARFLEHPFLKEFESVSEVMERWKKGSRLLGGRFPDMALRKPFRYKTVFECKYFCEDNVEAGDRALVEGIYEAFYYLGLPDFPKGAGREAWDYDFACFLAEDASVHGTLCKAWGSVSKTAKRVMWEGGNIYVMIVRGQAGV